MGRARLAGRASKRASNAQNKVEGMTAARALFSDVMHGSTNTTVDPRSCLPLTRIRRTSISGVLRLKRIFRGGSGKVGSAVGVGESVGFVAGSDMPIVIPLEGALSRYIIDYFCEEKEMSDKDAREEARSRKTWYGVIDGAHRLLAIVDLIREDPESWDGFQWPVIMLKGGHSLQVLRQLARQQNRKLSEQHYVETTLFDQLSGLKKEAERLEREKGKQPTAREVVAAYDGSGALMDTTMQQMASTAMRLSHELLSVLGTVMNAELPELVEVPQMSRKPVGEENQDEVMSAVDCRVFRRFLNITSIKQATVFMKASGDAGVKAQVNTLYRCREISRASGFKSVPFKVVAEQFQKATLAMDECRKFEALIESEKWPIEMETMKKNMLETTKLDEAISRNVGNDSDVLQDLLDKYKSVCPAISSVKIQKHRALNHSSYEQIAQESAENENSTGQEQFHDTHFIPDASVLPDGAPMPDNNAESGEENLPILDSESAANLEDPPADIHQNSSVVEDSNLDEQLDEAVLEEREDREGGVQTQASERLDLSGGPSNSNALLLKSLYIECHQMKWQDFDKTVLSQEESAFDLILTDPPYGVVPNPSKAGTKYKNYVDDQEMKEFGQFCRRVLVPGGYVFLFTSAKYFYRWCESFREADFKVCEYPFVLNKDISRLQRSRLEDFPQCAAELAFMARAPGKTASSFKPNFASPFHLFECSQKRRFSSVLNAPIPRRKLTDGTSRAPLLTEEKNPYVLGEIMITFCPEGGRVLDCYAGTCTTAIAALETARRCVCVEMSADIYRLALRRLLTIAPNYKNESKRAALAISNMTASGPDPSIAQSVTKFNSNVETKNSEDSNASPKNNCIRGGDKVVLQQDKSDVGFATVQSSTGEQGGPLQKKIHSESLAEYEKDGEDLIVILLVSIRADCTKLPYIYNFPSQDELPDTLGDLYRSGVYVWDRKKMSLLV